MRGKSSPGRIECGESATLWWDIGILSPFILWLCEWLTVSNTDWLFSVFLSHPSSLPHLYFTSHTSNNHFSGCTSCQIPPFFLFIFSIPGFPLFLLIPLEMSPRYSSPFSPTALFLFAL